MTLDLQRVVDPALDLTEKADPHILSRDVLMRIRPEDREDALLLALAAYVEARVYERQNDPFPTTTVARADQLRTPSGAVE